MRSRRSGAVGGLGEERGSLPPEPNPTQGQSGGVQMTRIGFIGVGTMGLPMAKNLVKKGFAVTAYDLNPEAVRAAAAAGMTAAASAAEAVAGMDLVITMLPSSPHVEAVYAGDGGVLAAA